MDDFKMNAEKRETIEKEGVREIYINPLHRDHATDIVKWLDLPAETVVTESGSHDGKTVIIALNRGGNMTILLDDKFLPTELKSTHEAAKDNEETK